MFAMYGVIQDQWCGTFLISKHQNYKTNDNIIISNNNG